MASELRVNTLKDASGNNSVATSVVFAGTAKVWQDLNGETFGSRDSHNVSGNTDNGTGDYTHSYSSNMGNANYTFYGYAGDPNSQMGIIHIESVANKATGSIRYVTNYVNNTSGGGANLDCEQVLTTTHGDLA